MSGPCAKTVVTCTLVTEGGERIVGTNFCRRPQTICPRLPNEGYEKCKSICDQPGHAEEMALAAAGERARGARAYVEGISYACRQCQEAIFAAGVRSFTIGAPE